MAFVDGARITATLQRRQMMFTAVFQGRSQRGKWVHVPRYRKSIFATAPFVFVMVSIFCPWTPLGTFVLQTSWFVPLSKFLATPLAV